MRRTPPVVVQLQPQPAVQALVAALAAVTALGLAAWAISHMPQAWPLLLAVPLAAYRAWRQAAVQARRLRWDGEAWWLGPASGDDEARVQLDVVIDLDRWLLLRASAGPCWLPLAARQHPATWGALRATLFSALPRAADP